MGISKNNVEVRVIIGYPQSVNG